MTWTSNASKVVSYPIFVCILTAKWLMMCCFCGVFRCKVEDDLSFRDGQILNFVFVARTHAEQTGMDGMPKITNTTMPVCSDSQINK